MKAKTANVTCWFNTSNRSSDHLLSAEEMQAIKEIALIRDALTQYATQYEISLINTCV